MKTKKMITVLFIILLSLVILSACPNSEKETIVDTNSTVSTVSRIQNEEDEPTSVETSTSRTTTAKKTELVKKDWKQAYIDYIYDLEDSYDGLIVYYPVSDFTGDGIDDFICSLGTDSRTEKQIAVAYYNGGVSTLTTKRTFYGYDPYNYYVGEDAGTNGDWPDEGSRINYYQFSNGKFVYVKTDGYDNLFDHTSAYLYQTNEMINEIKKGNSHGFNF